MQRLFKARPLTSSAASASALLPLHPNLNPATSFIAQRQSFHASSIRMGVTKTTHQEGNGAIPKPGQRVTIEYTGFLKDTTKDGNKGEQFDSSVGRGDFVTKIGVGQVIKGWDEGVTQMKVGEKATLDITSDFAYGERGFTGHIPPNADLIFDVYLKSVQ